MRVLYFTRGQSPHDLRFTDALAKTEHQVFVLCLDGVAGRTWAAGITEVRLKDTDRHSSLGNFFRSVRSLRTLISEIKPDLIHAGPIQSAAFMVALAGFHPLVTMSWGSDILWDAKSNLVARWITRFTLARTDVLIGDCQSVGEAAGNYGFRLDRYRMFPWGVDLKQFSPQGSTRLRKKLGWEKDTVLLSNRTMAPLYDVETAARAFVILSESNPEMRMLLFGNGPHKTQVKTILSDAGVADNVYFGGVTENSLLPDVYRSADLYLSTSLCDGSSISLLEAMASGLPVVVSDIDGNREWVQEGKNGWLFKAGDAQDLVDTILNALDHPAEIEAMKKENRSLAESRADWDQNFPKLLVAYQLAVEIHKARGR